MFLLRQSFPVRMSAVGPFPFLPFRNLQAKDFSDFVDADPYAGIGSIYCFCSHVKGVLWRDWQIAMLEPDWDMFGGRLDLTCLQLRSVDSPLSGTGDPTFLSIMYWCTKRMCLQCGPYTLVNILSRARLVKGRCVPLLSKTELKFVNNVELLVSVKCVRKLPCVRSWQAKESGARRFPIMRMTTEHLWWSNVAKTTSSTTIYKCFGNSRRM